MDKVCFGREGISEDLQDARSGHWAVLREICLGLWRASVFPAKILS